MLLSLPSACTSYLPLPHSHCLHQLLHLHLCKITFYAMVSIFGNTWACKNISSFNKQSSTMPGGKMLKVIFVEHLLAHAMKRVEQKASTYLLVGS